MPAVNMATLLNCPAELRQQILGHCFPNNVHNAGVAPKTAPLLPLLLTCKALRLDVLQLLGTWSPVYHIEDPAAIVTTTSHRRLDDDEPHMRKISLRLFADLDLAQMHGMAPMGAVQGIFEVDPWLGCVASLPRAAVESVTVDLTPVPAWMAARRPDWVQSVVLDARNRAFLTGCAVDVKELVRALCRSYGAGVRVQLGGAVAWTMRRAVDDMMVSAGATGGHGAKFVGFTGEWLSGPSEVPTRLSLVLICRCWGVEVGGPAARERWYGPRMIQIRNEARKEGLTTPDLYLNPLFPVCWSENSCTAYYVNAGEDEKRTRGDLVRLLAFAVEVRAAGVPPNAVADFAPAIRARRFLLHCLARDLGLASVSVGDAGEKFVRVSRVAEAPAAAGDECELLESGDGGGEDLHERGEEDPTSSSGRVPNRRGPAEALRHGLQSNDFFSS
ncbi:hypothetical protein SLS64_005005 [Diaporthe eres]|uniref:R3H domain-containing protein n=1 Tax=Diaporthe eres TaxID=83184 RepID=A0ABR1NU49_DIAER